MVKPMDMVLKENFKIVKMIILDMKVNGLKDRNMVLVLRLGLMD